MRNLLIGVVVCLLGAAIAAHAYDARSWSVSSWSGWSSSSYHDDDHESDCEDDDECDDEYDSDWGGWYRDESPPTVTAFSLPGSATSLTVPVTLAAADNVKVTGYLITTSSTRPSLSSPGWQPSPPNTYTFTSPGYKILYAWARDAAGNVSWSKRAATMITLDTTPPVITAFTMPATSGSLVVPVVKLTATDNVAVTGYLLTESATVPSPAAAWTSLPPATYTFGSAGNKTLYAWARDAAGNVSARATADVVITVPQGEAVLIITSPSNPFTNYYPEILRAEGLNHFATRDIAAVSPAVLALHDLVILGEMPLSPEQVAMLESYVRNGGNLIAMRPDRQLAGLLGIAGGTTTLNDGYLKVNNQEEPGFGIVGESIQYHGTADRYTLNGASGLATLYSDAITATVHPAVTLASVGSSGGQAAAFTYDLARSVVYTRQGNPAWAGQERDGIAPIRSNDLFYGAASFDPRPDWVDLNKVAIPQADEQQRLLANLIILMNRDKKPLPRFWYLPRDYKAAVVMTGDDHSIETGAIAARFDALSAKSLPGCSVENWECLRGTAYAYPDSGVTEAQAAAYDAAGFELAPHVTTGCADWTPATLAAFYSDQLSIWKTIYPSLSPPLTHRTHCIPWSDYATQPAVELANGMRLDTNYYFYPPGWVGDRPGLFTGSGMPMRFADANGTPINVYQGVTQMTDESGQSYPRTIDALLDRALGPDGYYGTFTVNAHTDFPATDVSGAIVASAVSRGVPVISARQLLTWLDGRNASTFRGLSWNGNLLRFTISSAPGATGLTGMVPVQKGMAVSRMTRDGAAAAYSLESVKGIAYVRFPAIDAAYEIQFAVDAAPPNITGVTPDIDEPAASPLTDVAVRMDEPLNPATVNGETLLLLDPGGVPVPAKVSWNQATNSAVLSPLAPLALSTTYTAILKGGPQGVRDLAGNGRTADLHWRFTTAPTMPGPFSIWSSTTLPGIVDSGPDNPVEVGVKFRSDRSGTITAIRFYKAAGSGGSHQVSLWTSDGTLLASTLSTAETESGWQQVNLPTPVAIAANTVYVASCHAPAGHFSIDYDYFTGKGADNPPLHALGDGATGANGVFAYGPAGTFPNQGYRGSNYWVDVVFRP